MLELAGIGETMTVDTATEVSGVATEALPERVKMDSEVLLLTAVMEAAEDEYTTGLEAGTEAAETLEIERPAALLELGAELETGVKPVRESDVELEVVMPTALLVEMGVDSTGVELDADKPAALLDDAGVAEYTIVELDTDNPAALLDDTGVAE